MDAAARRRELRKRKILQNAEDRIKKLTENVGVDVTHGEKLEKQADKENSLKEVHQNFETKREKTLHQNTLNHNDDSMQDNVDGRVMKKEIDDSQPDVHVYNETEEQEIDNEPEIINPDTEGNSTTDSRTSKVRPVIVMVFATLWFTKSLFLPIILSVLGSPWFLEIYNDEHLGKSSFIIPFCILEIFLLLTPSLRKVTPGRQVNIWLLALKLCGVSPLIVDTFKIVILEILEFLTDLAMFIFVLVMLQSGKELQL